MGQKRELCWYCRERKAEIWCDFMLGSILERRLAPEPPEIKLPPPAAPSRPTQLGLLDAPAPAEMIPMPVPASRAKVADESAKLEAIRAGRDIIATCDAAACMACAKRHGWRRVGHICGRPKVSQTIDHCHVHASGDAGLGSTAWTGAPAIDLLRRDVRSACARASIKVTD